MSHGKLVVRIFGPLLASLLWTCTAAAADERELVDQYNAVVGKLNADEFAEARKLLAALEKSAKGVPRNDPAYERAQEFLKRAGDLRLSSYRNSALQSLKTAGEAVRGLKLDQAAGHFEQAASDFGELVKLEPGEKRYQEQASQARQQLAQVAVVQAMLAGKPAGREQHAAAAAKEPQPIYQAAPGFALPRLDRPELISPLDQAGQVVVAQVFQAADETSAFAAQTAKAIDQGYAKRGLKIVSISIDEGDDVARLDEFVAAHKPAWPVALDDRGDFYQQYMQGGYRLPAYVVVGRDRQAWWLSGGSPLETAAMLAGKIEQELGKSAARLPAGPLGDFPPATPFPATSAANARPVTIAFGGKPALVVAAMDADDGPHFAELVAVAKHYGDRLRAVAIVRSDKFAEVHSLAQKHALEFHQVRWGTPECYGPNFKVKLVLVSPGGRILKVAPLSTDAQHMRAVLARYATLLTTPGAYPSAADAPLETNLLLQAAGGSVESVGSARQQGSQQRLNDGISGAAGWEPAGNLPQEVTLSFLGQFPATFDRLTIDRRSGLWEFEVLAADSQAGPYRSLGTFRAAEREARQAFELPRTESRFLKLRLLSTVGERSQRVEIGEIEVGEAAGAEPALGQRLAAHFQRSQDIETSFQEPGIPFWQRTDFVFVESRGEWQSDGGHLEFSGLPPVGQLRATALLHAGPAVADFRLRATVVSRSNQAGGIVFGFRDWDNHLRLVLVQGHVQTGRSAGNSIRLERWLGGDLEVLGVHGEAFPHGEPIRLEIMRQGEKLAVTAQDKLIFSLSDVPIAAGRIGFCAAGGGSFQVDEVRLTPLPADAPWEAPPLTPLTTAAGASLAWLNSQGGHQQPQTWASNLLRTPVFAPPAAWEATRVGQEPPEAVFAFRDHGEVVLEGVQFQLPARTEVDAQHLARKVEVLVSGESPLDGEAFRSVGQFTLQPVSVPQKFALKSPAPCRYVKLRLLENGGSDRFVLAGFAVQLGESMPLLAGDAPRADLAAAGRERIERQFAAPADDAEQEPNDEVSVATRLREAKSLGATAQFGEVDFFRLPPPPPGNGLKTLRVSLDALPWLRLKAALCDETGAPAGPPLAHFTAGQHAEQTRQFGPSAEPPGYVRVEMPPASLALVLDTSLSMKGREEDVRAAVQSYLAGAGESERIEVIEFNTDVGIIGRLPDERQKVTQAIERLGVRGNTALYQALLAGMEKNQAVVLLSDGMNTVFEAEFTELCRRLKQRPVPIYVIGIGWDLHEYDANSGNTAYSLLANLARQTGGRFYFSPESQQLQALYQQIAAEVRGQTRYRLRAEWEVSQRTVELASIDRGGASRLRPFSLPLPPDLPELALGAKTRLSRGPKSAGMPPGLAELAPLVSRGASRGPAIVSLPSYRESELARLPLRSSSRPKPLPLPELVELSVLYQPPKAGDPLLPPAVLPAFELIFDSSESMAKEMDGKPKIEIARKVISELAAALPANAQVGLRLYGHWGPWIARKTNPQGAKVGWDDPRLNTDSDLVVPIGPIDAKQRAELKRWINWTQPRGKTPMVYSLLEARKDFSADWKGPRTVILVSDGLETCGGKLEDLAKAYRGAGIEAVIHVVGFDIAETEAEKQLRQIATIGGGDYYGAENARQLSAALKAAAAAGSYLVYDEEGNLAGRGIINGEPLPLLPGTYRVRLSQVKAKELEVAVTNGPDLRLKLREDGTLQAP